MATEVKFVKDDVVIGTLSLDEVEPITNVTFGTIACDLPQIILARVCTRDRTNFKKKYVHNYYGPNLIRILFSSF